MKDAPPPISSVDIRPGVSVLSVLRHLNYRPWFALAEFVDNALQSALNNQDGLQALHKGNFCLQVRIDIDATEPSRIKIRDNAAGIAATEYRRAFRPAAIPPDCSGLSEFGMGMKSAACWFAPRWTVRTSALGEGVERTVKFDIGRIVNDQIEELQITEAPQSSDIHFTEVILEDLHHKPVGRTISKIKEHLTDIYRVFIRNGLLELRLGNDVLTYQEPAVLTAVYEREATAGSRLWKKDIKFDFGGGMHVTGFAALRDPGNFARSGFALFRRDRLIQGSGDEGYRPGLIFGQPGSFRSLRLFGELHLNGFEVSHTKDGFRWDENEQPFLELLKEHLDSPDLPLLKQADAFRALASRADRTKAAQQAVEHTADAMERHLPGALPKVADEIPVETPTQPLPVQPTLVTRELKIRFRDQDWTIRIELTDDKAEADWLSVSDQLAKSESGQVIELRMSLAHPFMVRFAQTDPDEIEALLRLAAGVGLAEKLARQSGVRYAGTMRRNLNELLKDALSQA